MIRLKCYNSCMVDEVIIKKILETDFNQTPTVISHIPDKGNTNEIYIIELAENKLVIRISPESNISQFEKEKWGMEQAVRVGVLVPKIIKVGTYESTVYMIQEYIDGLHGTDDSVDKTFIWKELGRYAKAIHSISSKGFGDYMSSPGVFGGDWNRYVDYNIQGLDESDKLLSMNVLTAEQSKKIKTLFENLKEEAFNFGLNHGDISLKNVIVNNDKVVLLDWGSSESHVVPHFDIVEVLQSSFDFDSENQYFKAFISAQGITDEDFLNLKPSVDAVILLRAIDHLRWAIDKKTEKVEHMAEVVDRVLSYLKI